MRTLLLATCFFMVFEAVAQGIYIPKFDLQGHRGARGLMPENTIPAFLLALDSGVTTLEMDLAVTADKVIVISHDPWMSASICLQPDGSEILKKDERSFKIYDMTYDEVRQFDCGSRGNERFPEQQKMIAAKPRLVDVIMAVEDHIRSVTQYECDYNIEIKTSPEGDNKFHPSPEEVSEMVYTLLNDYLPMKRVVIQSFDFRVLRYWHDKHPEVRLSALVENTGSVSRNLKSLGFKPAVYSPEFSLLSNDDIRDLHQQKIRVIPWTVNDLSDMRRMLQMNVDGIITDYPNRAAQLGLGIKRPKN